LVPTISLRDDSGSSAGTMPTARRSGSVSSKMRPLERAKVSVATIGEQNQGSFYRTVEE
jgi:hypothetical protein